MSKADRREDLDAEVCDSGTWEAVLDGIEALGGTGVVTSWLELDTLGGVLGWSCWREWVCGE